MKKIIYIVMFLILVFPISSYALTEDKGEDAVDNNTIIVTLEACVDGDTAKFKLDDEIFTARFLAIDTPETVHPTKEEEPFGKEASNHTCDLLTNAKEIKLEYDDDSDKEDNYGRKLVWVFVDDVLLQESLISKGYAEVAYLYGNYKYTSLLKDSEVVAKVNKLGVWSIDEEEVVDDKAETEEEDKKEKSFFDELIDSLLAKIADFIDELFEKLLKMIEEML